MGAGVGGGAERSGNGCATVRNRSFAQGSGTNVQGVTMD